jgi:hypothetical protein
MLTMIRRLLCLACLAAILAACGASATQTSPADTPVSVATAALTALAAGDQATLAPLLGDELSADERDDMRIQWRGSACNTLESVEVLGTSATGAATEVRLQARCSEAVDGLAFTLAAQGGTYRIVDWRMLPFEELEK